jgi:lauroyl/myristoyl acyltransferase
MTPDERSIGNVRFAVCGPRIRRKWLFWSAGGRKVIREFASLYRQARTSPADVEPAVAFADAEAPPANPAPTSLDSEAGRHFRTTTRAVLGFNDDETIARLRQQAAAATRRRRQLQTWMHVHPGWMPAIELKGEAHAAIANARERPVIYWVDNTVFAELVARAGLHQAGIRAHHYSDWVHEYGQSLLSRTILQRRIFQLEQRFMDERIVSHPHTHFRSMRKFATLMRGNGAIFHMNNAYLGRRHACVPLGPDTWLIQATAPLNMARRYNALIVPVTAVELEPLSTYQVEFNEPLEADLSLNKDEDIARMAALSATRQLNSMKQFPAQWLCWSSSQLAAPEAGRIYRPGM